MHGIPILFFSGFSSRRGGSRMPGQILWQEEVKGQSWDATWPQGTVVLLHDLECTFYMQTKSPHYRVCKDYFVLVFDFYTNPPTQNFVHILMWLVLLIVPFNHWYGRVDQLWTGKPTMLPLSAVAYQKYKTCVWVCVRRLCSSVCSLCACVFGHMVVLSCVYDCHLP